jgi:hypothetical protein
MSWSKALRARSPINPVAKLAKKTINVQLITANNPSGAMIKIPQVMAAFANATNSVR